VRGVQHAVQTPRSLECIHDEVTRRPRLSPRQSVEGRYDVIVVGAGTAGCLIAAGVAARSDATVLLVEEGPDRTPEEVRLLARQQEARSGELVRRLGADGGSDGPSRTLMTGRVLGGGWSIGHAAMVTPTDRDLLLFSEHAGVGSRPWRPAAVAERIARRIVDLDLEHAGEAPSLLPRIPVRRTFRPGEPVPPAVEDLLGAAERHGLDLLDDIAGSGDTVGVCAYPQSAVDGVRRTSANIVLDAARVRPGLTVLGDTTVERILLDRDRAAGLLVRGVDGRTRSIGAEIVVLAAGAYHSPQLLMRSGIGPSPVLEEAGIPVLHDLSGVGQGLRDHARVEIDLPMTPIAADAGQRFGDALRLHLRARTTQSQDGPDVDLSLRHPKGRERVVLMVRLLEQRTPGAVELALDGGHQQLRVRTGIAADDADVAALREGLAIGAGILTDAAMQGRHRLDGSIPSAAELRASASGSSHGIGTCRMGGAGDPGRVVGPDLRVDGLEGLIVADASVLPVLPHAGPVPAVVAVGELAVDEILAELTGRAGSSSDARWGN